MLAGRQHGNAGHLLSGRQSLDLSSNPMKSMGTRSGGERESMLELVGTHVYLRRHLLTQAC